ncbi:hypothetical protein V6N11_053686 [Hibiscus sabdariffa]|uniref:Uncharacterized protein n=1 Tax=Hibiscus sabdariffa TaxID=183260 RepID=A0ABR2S1M2_9ROSI
MVAVRQNRHVIRTLRNDRGLLLESQDQISAEAIFFKNQLGVQDSEKASKSNGFTSLFFKVTWEIVADDMINNLIVAGVLQFRDDQTFATIVMGIVVLNAIITPIMIQNDPILAPYKNHLRKFGQPTTSFEVSSTMPIIPRVWSNPNSALPDDFAL